MTLCRLILPEWAKTEDPSKKKVLEGFFSDDDIVSLNLQGYNVYYLPNPPSHYAEGTTVTGADIDQFQYVFVDCDLKAGVYKDKGQFLEALNGFPLHPTRIVDSGNGIHAYWRVSNLDANSYLRLQKRLIRRFDTDDAVAQIFQLMRLPGTLNTKEKDNFKLCDVIVESGGWCTAEQMDNALPKISMVDEAICQQHHDRTYNLEASIQVPDVVTPKWGKLLNVNAEVKRLWTETTHDRSGNDWRLAHLLFAEKFTKEEAASVLVNSAKALQRAPVHRVSYAQNIIDKIWTYEAAEDKQKAAPQLSRTVRDILQRGEATVKGTSFRCHPYVDNTHHGFRLGQVLGLVAGSGVGKTAFALNMFRWFVQRNPDYDHLFIPLEQPDNEIADRWRTMCGTEDSLHDKVHIMSNYDDDGTFRHLSLDEIKEYVLNFTKTTGRKIGCVVIDHVGALKKRDSSDEKQGLMDICQSMKAFAIQTNTLLVMQSQTSREKAGIGDLELNKDAAYGTTFFEAYVDYLITLWQPLKRCHREQACPTVTAFKFCKIRHKKAKLDAIQEDTPYHLYFDSDNETLRSMTQDEETSFKFFLNLATNKRKADRKTELLVYQPAPTNKDNTRPQGTYHS